MTEPSPIETYWNRHIKTWSLRAAPRGLVFEHASAVALAGCEFIVAESSRLRCIERRQRDVHAFIRGVRTDASRPADAIRIGYRPAQPGFRRRDTDEIVAAASAVWFEADGSAWALAPTASMETRQ